MYSIKPGRGPSWGGAFGSLVAVGFGIFWTIAASSIGASGFLVIFGIVFVLVGLGSAAYHFYNATSDNRISTFDITTPGEESDPFNTRSEVVDALESEFEERPSFCSKCGTKLKLAYEFCPKCGKEI